MAKYFGPALSIITFIIWMVISKDFTFAFSRAIAVLILCCPLFIGLASKMAIKSGKRVADKNGIIFKSDNALKNAGKAQIIALEMTGTVTEGQPAVTDINSADHFTMSGYAVGGYSDDELLEVAALLGKNSQHPISRSIIKFTDDILIEAEDELEDFKIYPNRGLEGYLNGILLRGGFISFIEETVSIPGEIKLRADELAATGKIPIFYSKGKRLIGLIAVSDKIDREAEKAISEFKGLGLKVIMIADSYEETAKAISEKVGVDEMVSGVPLVNKEDIIRKLSAQGMVAMVGRDNDDEVSLKAADIGFAHKEKDDAITGAADVLLMNDSLFEVASAIRLSKMVLKKIKENVILLVIFCIIFVPFAGGVFYSLWGLVIGPVLSLVLMGLSCFLIFANSLRLNDFAIDDTSKDRSI